MLSLLKYVTTPKQSENAPKAAEEDPSKQTPEQKAAAKIFLREENKDQNKKDQRVTFELKPLKPPAFADGFVRKSKPYADDFMRKSKPYADDFMRKSKRLIENLQKEFFEIPDEGRKVTVSRTVSHSSALIPPNEKKVQPPNAAETASKTATPPKGAETLAKPEGTAPKLVGAAPTPIATAPKPVAVEAKTHVNVTSGDAAKSEPLKVTASETVDPVAETPDQKYLVQRRQTMPAKKLGLPLPDGKAEDEKADKGKDGAEQKPTAAAAESPGTQADKTKEKVAEEGKDSAKEKKKIDTKKILEKVVAEAKKLKERITKFEVPPEGEEDKEQGKLKKRRRKRSRSKRRKASRSRSPSSAGSRRRRRHSSRRSKKKTRRRKKKRKRKPKHSHSASGVEGRKSGILSESTVSSLTLAACGDTLHRKRRVKAEEGIATQIYPSVSLLLLLIAKKEETKPFTFSTGGV